VFGLSPAGALKGFLNFRSGFTFAMLEGWKDFLQMSDQQKVAALRDPATRARLKAGAESPNNPVQGFRGIENYIIEDVRSEKNARWKQRTIGEYAAEQGQAPFEALMSLAAEEELGLVFAAPEFGADDQSWSVRKEVWDGGHVLIGASDAGAHLDMINTFAITTQLLGEAVRRRGAYTLEEGVWRMTGELADAFGLRDRGRIEQGAIADLVVFDPDTVDCGPIAMRSDLPGEESRLYADAVGIQHVIVGGVPVAQDNQPTGRVGGRMLRSGRDTYTVPMN
jgi:N-acyl-D-aspartate/D-glutamate deacylase